MNFVPLSLALSRATKHFSGEPRRRCRCFWDDDDVVHSDDDMELEHEVGDEPSNPTNRSHGNGGSGGKSRQKQSSSLSRIASARSAPWYVLVGIGLFNGAGNFCMALAQPHTSGLTQTLLNLLGIPLVLLLGSSCTAPLHGNALAGFSKRYILIL